MSSVLKNVHGRVEAFIIEVGLWYLVVGVNDVNCYLKLRIRN